MMKRGRWRAPSSKGESATRLSSYPVLAPLACRLIGRAVACAEYIGKAIRKPAGNRAAQTFAIALRHISWKWTVIIAIDRLFIALNALFRKHVALVTARLSKKIKILLLLRFAVDQLDRFPLYPSALNKIFSTQVFTSKSYTTNSKANITESSGFK